MAARKLYPWSEALKAEIVRLVQDVAKLATEDGRPWGIANTAGELLADMVVVREVSLPRPRSEHTIPRGESKSVRHKRILAEVRERDGGQCCARGWNGPCRGMLHHDHFYGRAKAEEARETLWLLCARHHEIKTRNHPDRIAWLELYRIHCTKHGYAGEVSRLDGMVQLELAQHPEHQEVAS